MLVIRCSLPYIRFHGARQSAHGLILRGVGVWRGTKKEQKTQRQGRFSCCFAPHPQQMSAHTSFRGQGVLALNKEGRCGHKGYIRRPT